MTTPIGRSGLARATTAPGTADQIKVPAGNQVAWFDDFLGDALDARWNYVEGTDGATADGAILAGGIGGILRLTTGDAGTGDAADGCAVNMGQLQWQASNGGLSMQTRLKVDALATLLLFVGFTDTVALEAPVESAAAGDTLVSNASDAVGFMFDARMTTDNFWLVGVKADVDAVKQDSAVAPVAGENVTLRVEVTNVGEASFYINGVLVGSQMLAAITPTTDLTPVVYASNTSGTTSHIVDVDYVHVAMNR